MSYTELNTPVESTATDSFQTTSQDTASTKVIVVQMTFSDSLRHIQLAKARSTLAYYDFLASILKAYDVGFNVNTTSEAERTTNTDLLNKECGLLKIEGKSVLLKLVKLAIGADAKAASSIAHVLKVAKSLGTTPENFTEWLTKKGGIQNVRTSYDENGNEKQQSVTGKGTTGRNGSSKDKSDDANQYAEKARESLTDAVIFTVPHGQIGLIAEQGEEAECTAILKQLADGSFVIKAVIKDAELIDAAYASHGRNLPTTDDQQSN